MFENPRRGRQARIFRKNVPKILDLKSAFELIFSENCRWVPLSVVKNPMSKLAVHVKKGLVRFLPYDRLLRPFLGDLRMSFSKYGYAIVWREILLRACTSRSSQLFVARLGSINFV